MISAIRCLAPCVVLASTPIVIKDTLGHSKVDLAMNVYDKASVEDIRAGLKVVSQKLFGSDLLPKNLLPTTPKADEDGESAA